jgi:hypothetical protein
MTTTTRTTTQSALQKNWQIEQLPGINPEDREKLKEFDIETTFQLLKRANKREGRQKLADQMQVNVQRVVRWVVMARLARIPSVGCHYCELLLNIGIYSASQLTRATVKDLQKRIVAYQEANPHRPKLCPNPAKMTEWIQEAQKIVLRAN